MAVAVVVVCNQGSLVFVQRVLKWNVLTGMGIGVGPDVVELDNVAALEAALNGALTGDLSIVVSDDRHIYQRSGQAYGQPVDNVGVGRVASATGILFVTSSVDEDGVLQCSYDHFSFPNITI
jgi:hypothetical protein